MDRGNELSGHVIQWPHLRIAELYLSYAEALNEYNGGPNSQAYQCVNEVRARVGLGGLKTGMTQEQFREAVLRERACEFGYEEYVSSTSSVGKWKISSIHLYMG